MLRTSLLRAKHLRGRTNATGLNAPPPISLLHLHERSSTKLPLAQFVREQLPQRLHYALALVKDNAYSHSALSILPNQHAPRMERLLQAMASSVRELEQLPASLAEDNVGTLSVLMQTLQKQQHELLAFVCRGLAVPHVHMSMLQDGAHDKELKTLARELFLTEQMRQQFINEFYNASLGMNVLINEWLASMSQMRGVEAIPIAEAVQHVANQVTDGLTAVPQVNIRLNGDKGATVVHSPAYLKGILRVILDRAILGTAKNHLESGGVQDKMPPVNVVIVPGESDVSLRVSDASGGMSSRKAEQLWMWPTRRTGECPARQDSKEFVGSTPHHGWPAARLTARYFGGDLNVVPVDGVGMDTFVHIWQQLERQDIMDALHDYVQEVELREVEWKE